MGFQPAFARCVVALALALPALALAAPAPPGAAERAQVQAERAALQARIREVETRMRAAEREQAAAADALQESEQAISSATRRLAELEAEGERLVLEQAALEARGQVLDSHLQQRQDELAQLLRQLYQQGADSPWRAMLSGNDPHEAGRRLGYLGYLSRARSALMAQIAREQAALAEVQAGLRQRQAQWQAVREQQAQQQQERLRQQEQRRTVLARIGTDLAAQQQQAERLKGDAERLSALIAEINQTLARQAADRARQEAAREAQRQAEAQARAEAARDAAARAEAARQAAAQAAATPDPLGLRPDEMAVVPPARTEGVPTTGRAPRATLAQRNPGGELASAPASARATPAAPAGFASLQGRLPLPMAGTVSGRFGEARPDAGNWRGVFIQASSGSPARAVAGGTVVFSGWLRGFGNLLIIDHGADYLTVYGNAEAILKQVGDAVGAGDAVATAGSSGGLAQSGIYFEIRHRGTPVNPLSWSNSP